MLKGYVTVQQIAEKWNVTPRTVQSMCSDGRIQGVTKFGRSWVIPEDAKKPPDNRITTGKYKNWRKRERGLNGVRQMK